MKAYAEALEPDERYRIMMIDDAASGLRPITFVDHHAMVAALQLPSAAPETVSRLYQRALHAFLYGWFDYELMVVAAGQALASVEFALKAQLGDEGRKLRGLAPRLSLAASQGKIAPPMSGPWGDTHGMLAAIRNEIAHGSDHVYPPNLAATIFDHCRAIICELYGLPPPATVAA